MMKSGFVFPDTSSQDIEQTQIVTSTAAVFPIWTFVNGKKPVGNL